jgi:toxin HigB-1
MIKSFKNKFTENIFDNGKAKNIDKIIASKASDRLDLPNAANSLNDLKFPPSNRLKKLEGFNPKRYSIRINKQWRVTFEWADNNAYNVCFEDYH